MSLTTKWCHLKQLTCHFDLNLSQVLACLPHHHFKGLMDQLQFIHCTFYFNFQCVQYSEEFAGSFCSRQVILLFREFKAFWAYLYPKEVSQLYASVQQKKFGVRVCCHIVTNRIDTVYSYCLCFANFAKLINFQRSNWMVEVDFEQMFQNPYLQ